MSAVATALLAWVSASIGASGIWSALGIARLSRDPQRAADLMLAIVIAIGGLQLAAMLALKMIGALKPAAGL